MVLSTGNLFIQKGLTRSALLDFLCGNSNNVQDFNHYFHDCIQHFLVQCRFSVNLQSSEKRLQALEYLKKDALACTDILSRLRGDRITMSRNIVTYEYEKGYALKGGRQMQ
jgi:hypothetical protein